MNEKENLLFYNAYEDFYAMADTSETFRKFCIEAFGSDFSQDGFSDKSQIDLILKYIPSHNAHILDIGCGNGKMLGYLQNKTGAFIHGFDYSEQAIKTAAKAYTENADFQEGVIGKIQYPDNLFDLIISMDTIYFADDMSPFVSDIKRWLKPNGIFFIGYQGGDVMPKTEYAETTVIAKALAENGILYEYTDITFDTYSMLKRKRLAALSHKAEFEAENNTRWFDLLMCQTECSCCDYDEFSNKMARYIFIARKKDFGSD